MRRPRIAESLLRGFIADPGLEEAILGDLLEEWNERAEGPGPGPSPGWYWRQLVKSAPHLLREWWLQQGSVRALLAVGRVASVLLLTLSLAITTLVGGSHPGGGLPGLPFEGDAHALAIEMVLAGALWAAAGGLVLAWRTARAPMCSVLLLGLSWVPATLLATEIFPAPGPPTWFFVAFPVLLVALTLLGGSVATVLGGARHRKHASLDEHVPLDETDSSDPEESVKQPRTTFRLAARPLLAAAVLLTVPLVAMQFTDEVVWTLFDFVFMGALVFGTGLAFELALRKRANTAYRWATGLALAAGFLLVWVTGAVGIIGSAASPANLMYGPVVAVGVAGAFVARGRALGMARALVATAAAQALVALIAIGYGLGRPYSGAVELLLLNGFWIGLFLVSAELFRNAARDRSAAGAEATG